MSKNLACLVILLVALLVLAASPLNTNAQEDQPRILVLTMEGPLTPSMAEYLGRGLRAAEQQGAEMVIVQLNTPGGGIDIMNRMVEDIRASSVPVVVYVAPRGAMAGSAGAVLTLAGHASAMAPETAIGAASPVGGQGEELGETMEAKQKNITKATVRSLAVGRGEEAVKLAESMIESAEAVSALEAKDAGLIDFIALNLEDLASKLDGFTVETSTGEQTLETANAEMIPFNTSFIEDLLGILTNPNIVFLLLTIGVQAILIELSSPGGWVAGFVGIVCLLLAAYGIGVLDVNWFGAIFLVIAFVLFILDIKAPTHGALTAAGVASLIVGALVLFNSPSLPYFQPRVSVPLVIATSIVTGAFFFLIVAFAIRAQKMPVRMGLKSLVGKTGIAHTRLAPQGLVKLASEEWTAELEDRSQVVEMGRRIVVVRVEGVRLVVKQLE